MSKYKLISRPPKWVSAHRENRLKVRLPQSLISSGVNSSGFLRLLLSGAFPTPLAVGDRIYIPNLSPYTGYHTITAVNSQIDIVLSTAYQAAIGGAAVVWSVDLPIIRIYKGYKQSELIISHDVGTTDLYDLLPYTLVAQFLPEPDATGYIDFDICGYLKTVIDSPYIAAYNPDEDSKLYPVSILGVQAFQYAPLYYNRVQVVVEVSGATSKGILCEMYACNASITTDELNRNFVDTGRILSPLKQPVELFDRFNIGNYINNNLLTIKIR